LHERNTSVGATCNVPRTKNIDVRSHKVVRSKSFLKTKQNWSSFEQSVAQPRRKMNIIRNVAQFGPWAEVLD
jgi:hypothetical protein